MTSLARMFSEMDYIYITNNSEIATKLLSIGVRWLMVDLEFIGKNNRQIGRDTVISNHSVMDIRAMRAAVETNSILVRINPMGEHSENEIESAIKEGADALMLPFFKTRNEVESFVNLVDGRCKIFLLLETLDAIKNLDDILKVKGIDYIHLGLNDLHIERNTYFMFEFLADGSIEPIAEKFNKKNLDFGVGGVARYGSLKPPAERILTEHVRLNSKGVILSRSFMKIDDYNSIPEFLKDFDKELMKLNKHLKILKSKKDDFFLESNARFISEVKEISLKIKSSLNEV